MPRFAILHHDWPTPHFDFLLEVGATCRTWRLAAPPTAGKVLAEPLPDHRVHYLTYEGPVSGTRGLVTQWDAGTYRGDPTASVTLTGRRWQGVATWLPSAGVWNFAIEDC
jgi:hypothetical protein